MVMVIKKITTILLAATIFCTFQPVGMQAAEARIIQSRDEHDEALQAIKRGEIMSYSQIKKSVENRLGARVVNLRLRRTNNGWRYYLRLSRKDGRVVAATVDAKNGRIIRTQ